MVLNAEIEWAERCKTWGQKKAQYFGAQQALDDAMAHYLQAKGPPPTKQIVSNVDDLWVQMLEARAAVDEFIAAHTLDAREKANLPRHE